MHSYMQAFPLPFSADQLTIAHVPPPARRLKQAESKLSSTEWRCREAEGRLLDYERRAKEGEARAEEEGARRKEGDARSKAAEVGSCWGWLGGQHVRSLKDPCDDAQDRSAWVAALRCIALVAVTSMRPLLHVRPTPGWAHAQMLALHLLPILCAVLIHIRTPACMLPCRAVRWMQSGGWQTPRPACTRWSGGCVMQTAGWWRRSSGLVIWSGSATT